MLFMASLIARVLLLRQAADMLMSGWRAESDQIFKAAKAKGLDIKYYLYTDEGHGFARPSNRCAVLKLIVRACQIVVLCSSAQRMELAVDSGAPARHALCCEVTCVT